MLLLWARPGSALALALAFALVDHDAPVFPTGPPRAPSGTPLPDATYVSACGRRVFLASPCRRVAWPATTLWPSLLSSLVRPHCHRSYMCNDASTTHRPSTSAISHQPSAPVLGSPLTQLPHALLSSCCTLTGSNQDGASFIFFALYLSPDSALPLLVAGRSSSLCHQGAWAVAMQRDPPLCVIPK